eukprot:TRINITY_DN6138_c0_g1_i1.p1 TRINITY_DN6138_c0_g1~~TRINITY_DN6138_c0_g1_i1.p1  ORF type:complete len:467 (+),score=115.40 TRINITY_DN6138_c0_g1_i1:55-1401(+)
MSDPFEDPLHNSGGFDFMPSTQPTVRFADPVSESLDDLVAPASAPVARDGGDRSRDDIAGAATPASDLKITVTEPTKRGEGMDAHVVYRVNTKTTMSSFRYREFYCYRRFKDFDRLAQKLYEGHPGIIIPPLPDKGVIDRFGPGFEKAFIESRRYELQRFLRRCSEHTVLRNSPHLHMFLQATDDEWSEELNKGQKKSRSFFQFFKEAKTQVLGDNAVIEEWFESAKQHATTLDSHLLQERKIVERLQKSRMQTGESLKETGLGFIQLASGVHDAALLTALKYVGEAAEAVGKDESERAENECLLLDDLLADYVRYVTSFKDVIKARQALLTTYQTSQTEAASLHKAYDQLRLKGARADKLQEAKDKADKAAQTEIEVKQQVDDFSATLRGEMDRLDSVQASDFKRVLFRFVRSRITAHRAAAELWEATLPAIDAVASRQAKDDSDTD